MSLAFHIDWNNPNAYIAFAYSQTATVRHASGPNVRGSESENDDG